MWFTDVASHRSAASVRAVRAGLLCALALLAPQLTPEGAALTVYRLGGADQKEPSLGVPFEFVQLSWEDVDPARYGFVQSLLIEPDALTPELLEETANLTPSTLGGGLTFLRYGIWEKPESVPGWWPDRFSVLMADEDDGTFHEYTRDMIYNFDLGRPVHLRRVRFYTREDSHRSIPAYLIGVNDGDSTKDGERPYAPPGDNPRDASGSFQKTGFYDFHIVHAGEGARVVDLDFDHVPTRRLLFRIFSEGGTSWEIVEFQIYGAGFVPSSRYISNVLDLGQPMSLGPLSWAGAEGDGEDVSVELRMRAGSDVDPNRYWRYTFRGFEQVFTSASGAPLTREQYDDLEVAEKGDVTYDPENWDAWHASFDFAAGTGASPLDRPRRYLQFDLAFTSTPASAGRVDYVEFAASPRLITRAVAELFPDVAAVGEVTTFTYKVRPWMEPDDASFDAIRIDTPAQVLSVDTVGRLNGQEVEIEVIRMDEEGFAVTFPRIGVERTQELLEIGFQARIFEYDTPFTGRLFDSAAPHEVPQMVLQGEADEVTDSRTTRVALAQIPESAIRQLRLSSGVCTPNGDGVNDAIAITYQLVNLTGTVPARIGVYDLSGRKVSELTGEVSSGPVGASWNGTDARGALLPPGIYLLQLLVEADDGEDRVQRLVSLAY